MHPFILFSAVLLFCKALLPVPANAQELVVNNLSNNTVYVGICAVRDGQIRMCRYDSTPPLSEDSFDLALGSRFRGSTCGLSHKSMEFRAEQGDELYFALVRARGNVIRPSQGAKYDRKLWYMPEMGERTTPPTYNSQPFSIRHRCSYSVSLGSDIALLSTFHDTVIDWEKFFQTGQHTFLKKTATEGFLRSIDTTETLPDLLEYFWDDALFYGIKSGTLTFTIKP